MIRTELFWPLSTVAMSYMISGQYTGMTIDELQSMVLGEWDASGQEFVVTKYGIGFSVCIEG